jgi:hypothetical protein
VPDVAVNDYDMSRTEYRNTYMPQLPAFFRLPGNDELPPFNEADAIELEEGEIAEDNMSFDRPNSVRRRDLSPIYRGALFPE